MSKESVSYGGLRVTTRVLTSKGFIPISELCLGDTVYGSDGLPCKVTGIYPKKSKKMYKLVFENTIGITCDESHLWKVSDSGGTFEIKSVKQLVEEGEGSRYSIPLCKAIEFPLEYIPMDALEYGKSIREQLKNKDCEIEISSEYMYNAPNIRLGVLRGLIGEESFEKLVSKEYKVCLYINNRVSRKSIALLCMSLGLKVDFSPLNMQRITIHYFDKYKQPCIAISCIYDTEESEDMLAISVDSPDNSVILGNYVVTYTEV